MALRSIAVVGKVLTRPAPAGTGLPISGLARASVRAGQYLGIHFFSPVDKMALVEIIKGKATGERAVAKEIGRAHV